MGPYVPPGQSPPFEVVDDDHHSAWVIITAALGLVVSLACFLIRLYVRLVLIPPFARDDFVLLGATILAGIQSTLMFYACSRGFGTSITLLQPGRLDQIQTLITTSDVFSLLILYLSKCCVVAIYLRLTPQKLHNRASWATLALCTAWLVPAVLILLVDCELNKPWRSQGGQCRNLNTRWQFIAALDVITELILFLLAVVLLKGLFMSVKRKLAIGFAFIFRFPLIIFTLLHISTLRAALHDPDVTLAAVPPTVWLQVEVHYTLVACSVFCLRPFMAAVSTFYGTAGDSTLESSVSASRSRGTKGSSESGSGSGSNSNSNSVLQSMSRSRVQRKRAGTAPSSSSNKKEDGFCCGDEHIYNQQKQKQKQKKKNQLAGTTPSPDGNTHQTRTFHRRSIFSLASQSKQAKQGITRLDKKMKGKDGEKEEEEASSSHPDGDLIELMPRLQRQRARSGTGSHSHQDQNRDEDGHSMVIRKEVQYSVQYEYDEARWREVATPESTSDATVYV
ncbi:hypothetical protein NUU61_002605 [Penicillium alfredii]|uniref:Rhodopsin domain-containing protein n=1 Tax=Penicillium alfredii TaxID=1506179 RepID=A0A9W9FS05_9EURO|nr:uncharacterized protein NUU61_002605 [Penicillium alfredii]KAJ5105258.1 hypothetical protein NUU61_002605 [Penicillium alfredii]